MLKDNVLYYLRNRRNPKVIRGYWAGIIKDETTQDPYVNSAILRNIPCLVEGYLLHNGRDERFNTFIDELVDEIKILYP